MLVEFKKHLEANFPNLISGRFLLAISGGLDSVVLTHLCQACALDFSLAHCNFQLRGAESDAETEFVVDFARKLKKEIFVKRFDTSNYIKNNKGNVQIAARDLRYTWFAQILDAKAISTLVTAHHADDNLETFLINLSRGSGLDGFTGIPSKTETISRPLLDFPRNRILAYAKAEGLEWREDTSNADKKYLRNKIRHEIVPLLKELHPTFLDNFKHTQTYLKGTNAILTNHIEVLKSRIFEEQAKGFRISISELTVLQPQSAYLYALLKDYGFTAWNDVEGLMTGISGKEVRSKTHRLVRDREFLLLSALGDDGEAMFTIEEGSEEIEKPISMTFQVVDALKETSANILYVDKDSLKYPLVVRKWQKGDYFYPFGMLGKKKLSKYFKDEKIDVISKAEQWLLCSDNAIVWVVGRRADRRFSISKKTKTIVKITIPQ